MKQCCRCNRSLPKTSEFFFVNKSKYDRFRYECKDCSKQHVIANKEKIKKQRAEFQQRHKERLSETRKTEYNVKKSRKSRFELSDVWNTYKITEIDLRAMMDDQKGCCSICKESLVLPDSKKSYSIDHDHKTGSVRGLLCQNCNIGLGLFKDNINSLKAAISYLEN